MEKDTKKIIILILLSIGYVLYFYSLELMERMLPTVCPALRMTTNIPLTIIGVFCWLIGAYLLVIKK